MAFEVSRHFSRQLTSSDCERRRFPEAIPECGSRMRFPNVVPGYNSRMWFTDAISGCNSRLRFPVAILYMSVYLPICLYYLSFYLLFLSIWYVIYFRYLSSRSRKCKQSLRKTIQIKLNMHLLRAGKRWVRPVCLHASECLFRIGFVKISKLRYIPLLFPNLPLWKKT